MTAPTHIAFSTVVYLYLSIVFRIPLAITDYFLIAIASLLPDIDISSSGIGWRLKFLSSWIERKFGHRTITHSFIGTFCVSILALPLLFLGYAPYAMFCVGYFSHPFLDMFSKEGCQFYWPNQKWGVFPNDEEHRIEVGSNAENVLFVGFIILSLLLFPIASVGIDRTLHWVLADISSAVKDYHTFSSNYKIYAETEGVYRKIDTKIKGVYKVVDALSENTLLIEVNGKLRIVGKTESHIIPSSIRIKKGEKVAHYTQIIDMDGHTLGELARLEKIDHRLFGTLKTMSNFSIRSGVMYFNPITQSGSSLTLDYATYADVKKMGLENISVLASNILVKTILPPDSLFKPFSFIQSGTTVFPVEIPISVKEDVLVKPEQIVYKGTILVANSKKLREITLTESEIETQRKLRDQKSLEFSINYQEMEQKIELVNTGIDGIKVNIEAYQKSIGFEKEISKLKNTLEKLKVRKLNLLNRKEELISKDNSDRLRYQQKIAEFLAKKETLEVSALSKAEFDMEIVNIEFKKNKCILYLRRLKKDL